MIGTLLQDFEQVGLLKNRPAAEVLSLINAVNTLEEALYDVDYVLECVPETLEIKKSALEQIAELAPREAILASSTSSIASTDFTKEIVNRGRCLVSHPINPPHLHDLVELVPAPWTDKKVIKQARKLVEKTGMAVVELKKELHGFVVNRLQAAVLHEVFRLVAVSAVDIDNAMVQGLAPRWSFMGPFESIDLNAPDGIADYVTRYGAMYARFGGYQSQQQALDNGLLAQLEESLPRDTLDQRREWRDQRLVVHAVARNNADSNIGK